jgi:hypothetical protein
MHRQQCWISVRAGTVGDCLAGPHDLPQRLTGSVDRDFLLNCLQQRMENVPLAVTVWFTYDGARAHLVDHCEMHAVIPNVRNG